MTHIMADPFPDHSAVSDPPPGHVAIAGAGLIGLFCAWSLARRNVAVTLFDRTGPGRGASHAAAGMLAPAYEAAGETGAHPRLFDLCLAGAALWGKTARQLEAESGIAIDYRARATMAVAGDVSQLHHLNRVAGGCRAHGLEFESLDERAACAIEPALATGIAGALLLPSDAQVDNRRTMAALIGALGSRGITVQTGIDMADVEVGPAGVRLPGGVHADVLVDATGWQATGMTPVKGVALALAPRADLPQRVVRFGKHYLVPRRDRVILGATVQPGESSTDISGPAVIGLIDAAERICPGVARAEIIERWAGVRPRTGDLAPMIGWRGPRRYMAGGHYRNGVLLAPLTGELVAVHILTGQQSPLAAAFDPVRRGVRLS